MNHKCHYKDYVNIDIFICIMLLSCKVSGYMKLFMHQRTTRRWMMCLMISNFSSLSKFYTNEGSNNGYSAISI